MTGLLNRKAFADHAQQTCARAALNQRGVAMLYLDLDGFKTINDTYGHEIGDKFLVEVARRLSAGLHPGDVPGRWGGDEFIVLLPETPAIGALDAAEKIRAAVEANALAIDGQLVKTTVSVGVASYPEDGSTLDLMLAHADRNMYQAKLGGRNRVIYQTVADSKLTAAV